MENEIRNALSLTGHPFPEVDFEAPIRCLLDKSCDRFWDAFGAAAKNAGQTLEGDLFESLRVLCGFRASYQDRGEPYRPMGRNGNSRSALPGDLTPADLDLVTEIYTRAKEPALRARLGDILFMRKHDHKAALDAANSCVTAANALLTESGWLDARELFQRALQLGSALGRKKETFKTAEGAILAALQHPLAQTQPFFASYLLKIAINMQVGDLATLAQIAQTHADKATAAKDFRRARDYRILQADLLHFAKQTADESTARLMVAETYIEEGEQALQRQEPSYMVAAKFLAQGVEALRQAKGDPARITALRDRLLQYQVKSMDEMQSFEFEIDLRDIAEKAMEFVKVTDFREAIERLALGHSITDLKKLREEVIEGANEAPLTHLMGADIVNQFGQIQKSTGPLIGAVGEAAEKELESRMFQAAARSHWPCRAQGFIAPARAQIWEDHPVTISDFEYLVRHNPFIPPGHEGIFMRGLFYGLAGDTMLAVHLLVPQIENSIRHLLQCNGVDVSNLNSDLTQPVKLLGPLMDMPEAKEMLGEELMFEIRGLLIEKTGFGFRNNLAHGFITEWESNAESAINCWWLVLRMCSMTHKFLNRENSATAHQDGTDAK